MLDDNEKWIYEALAKLERDYHLAREPFIKMLVRIEELRPPKQFIVSREVAELIIGKNDQKTGSDIDAYLDRHPTAEFREDE